jgi:Cohesin domain
MCLPRFLRFEMELKQVTELPGASIETCAPPVISLTASATLMLLSALTVAVAPINFVVIHRREFGRLFLRNFRKRKTYYNLTANQTEQNYSAIMLGDVTGDWMPTGSLADLSRIQMRLDENAVAVSLPALNATRNQTVVMPVSIGDVTGRGFLAYDLDVSFDPAVLQLDAAAPADTTGTISSRLNFAVNAEVPGHLLVTAYDVNYLQGAGTLLNLRFRVVGQSGQISALTFKASPPVNQKLVKGTRVNGFMYNQCRKTRNYRS